MDPIAKVRIATGAVTIHIPEARALVGARLTGTAAGVGTVTDALGNPMATLRCAANLSDEFAPPLPVVPPALTSGAAAATGTIEVQAADLGLVIGTGTAFTTELVIGNTIQVGDEIKRVVSIASNTSLRVGPIATPATASPGFRAPIAAGATLFRYTQGIVATGAASTVLFVYYTD